MFSAIFLLSVTAGIGGAILGLGGGIIIVPALTLLLHLPIRFAIGASIVAVIAGSSGAAAYIRDRMTNLRIGLALEVMTTVGALTGAFIAGHVSPRWLYVIFGVLLAYSAVALLGRLKLELPGEVLPDPLAKRRDDSTRSMTRCVIQTSCRAPGRLSSPRQGSRLKSLAA